MRKKSFAVAEERATLNCRGSQLNIWEKKKEEKKQMTSDQMKKKKIIFHSSLTYFIFSSPSRSEADGIGAVLIVDHGCTRLRATLDGNGVAIAARGSLVPKLVVRGDIEAMNLKKKKIRLSETISL